MTVKPKSAFGYMEDAWRRQFEQQWLAQNAHKFNIQKAVDEKGEMTGLLTKFEKRREDQLINLQKPKTTLKVRKPRKKI